VKKNDIFLIGIILMIAVVSFLVINATKQDGDKVVIEIDGKFYKELPLNVDTTLVIETANGGTNTLVIENGHADVIDATCPDKICVDQKHIENNGETIICLPNKVLIEVQSGNENPIDSIAN
jgi:hypothetical protein